MPKILLNVIRKVGKFISFFLWVCFLKPTQKTPFETFSMTNKKLLIQISIANNIYLNCIFWADSDCFNFI